MNLALYPFFMYFLFSAHLTILLPFKIDDCAYEITKHDQFLNISTIIRRQFSNWSFPGKEVKTRKYEIERSIFTSLFSRHITPHFNSLMTA